MTDGDLNDAFTHPDELLSAYVDGELDSDDATVLEAHVADCADCAAELADIDRVRDMIRAMPIAMAPAGFVDELIRRRRRASRYGVVFGAAAAVVALVASVALADPGGHEKPSSVAAGDMPAYDPYDEAKIARFNSGRLQDDDKDEGENDADEGDSSLIDRTAEAASDLLGVLSGD